MKIDVLRLRNNPVVYDVDLSPEYLGEGTEEDIAFGPGRGQVTFRLVGDDVLAEGTLRTEISARCGRCLGDVRREIRAAVHLFYWPKKEETGSKILDIDPEEPDFGVYDGDTLDADDDLRELLLVEAPQVFLCREDCKGLCPRCGANLNQETCPCGREDQEAKERAPTAESLWKAQLRALKLPPRAF